MGPQEKSRELSKQPSAIDSTESDEDELARLRAEGWEVGFDVEMRAVGAIEIGRNNENARMEEHTTSDSDVSEGIDEDEGDDDKPSNGYQPLPINDPLTSPSAQWLPSSTVNNVSNVLPPPPSIDGRHIKHQPIDIRLDQDKIDEIKGIMAQISIPERPEWAQHINDRKLADLVEHFKRKHE